MYIIHELIVYYWLHLSLMATWAPSRARDLDFRGLDWSILV